MELGETAVARSGAEEVDAVVAAELVRICGCVAGEVLVEGLLSVGVVLATPRLGAGGKTTVARADCGCVDVALIAG